MPASALGLVLAAVVHEHDVRPRLLADHVDCADHCAHVLRAVLVVIVANRQVERSIRAKPQGATVVTTRLCRQVIDQLLMLA